MPDDDDLPKDLAHITPAYKRALWVVVLINVCYGIVEMIGGFLQILKHSKLTHLIFLVMAQSHS
ncbi:hypothetical protein [Nitrosopumilus piranensis]|uniref:hypothetical protein n=1 Tax=Nitrosopumilus piranensis TaxID=1582439 RepID=UPI000AD5E016|nr:hypothetical protein [Nitrosopumilus piranensis]